MAFYDPQTNKIYGCKKHSMIWWHERGHQILHNKGFFREFIRTYHQWILLFVIAFLTIEEFQIAKIILMIYIIPYFFDEIFAWIYCIKNYKNWRK